jgi:hypothetical protein
MRKKDNTGGQLAALKFPLCRAGSAIGRKKLKIRINFNFMNVSFRFKNGFMKKIALSLLTLSVVFISCSKHVYVPVSYSVEDDYGKAPSQFYIPSNGPSQDIDLTVKFLTGSATDSVTLQVEGLPAGITVSPQKSTGLPTYYYKYVYTTSNVAPGNYPVNIVASAPHTQDQVFNVNLVVIPPNVASLFSGNLSGSNACNTRSYTYTATGSLGDTVNTLVINNLGGYGLGTYTTAKMNSFHDSLTIPQQLIGNGVTISGYGTFTLNQLTIYYSAITTPGAAAEVCTATLTKN